MQALDTVTAFVEDRAEPAVVALLARGGDVGMHGRAAMPPGDFLDPVLQGTRHADLIHDIEGAELVGEQDRPVHQVMGQLERTNSYDAALLVSYNKDSSPISGVGDDPLPGEATPRLQVRFRAVRTDQRKGMIDLFRVQQTDIEFSHQTSHPVRIGGRQELE